MNGYCMLLEQTDKMPVWNDWLATLEDFTRFT
jgi:hypothetical protein